MHWCWYPFSRRTKRFCVTPDGGQAIPIESFSHSNYACLKLLAKIWQVTEVPHPPDQIAKIEGLSSTSQFPSTATALVDGILWRPFARTAAVLLFTSNTFTAIMQIKKSSTNMCRWLYWMAFKRLKLFVSLQTERTLLIRLRWDFVSYLWKGKWICLWSHARLCCMIVHETVTMALLYLLQEFQKQHAYAANVLRKRSESGMMCHSSIIKPKKCERFATI